jgi:peptidase M48-like protein
MAPDNLPARFCVELLREYQVTGLVPKGIIKLGTPSRVGKTELVMKSRLILLTAAFCIFGNITPAIFAQTQTQPPVNVQTGTQPPANVPADPGVSGTVPPAAPGDSAAQTSQPIQPADPSKVKHDGGRDDVDAVGNRKIGARGLGNWYSIESDIKMGKQYAQMVDSSSKLVSDPVVTEYVNRLGQNLVRNSDAQVPFTFKIIDSDVVNAMSLPGGFVYVDTATILAADGEAELAGVMAHEIAHVAARHATRQMTRGNYANIGTLPLIFMGGGIGYAVRSAAGIGMPMAFMSFQRGFEAEADYLGLQYMYKAGYDPQSFVSFFEKLQALEKKKPGTLAKTFASHPQTPDRIAASQEEIEKILPARPEYTVTTSEFDDVKARLAQLENRRKVVDDKDIGKPSLRRASATDKPKDGTTTSGDDDHPTLKRRDDSN